MMWYYDQRLSWDFSESIIDWDAEFIATFVDNNTLSLSKSFDLWLTIDLTQIPILLCFCFIKIPKKLVDISGYYDLDSRCCGIIHTMIARIKSTISTSDSLLAIVYPSRC